jgi:LPS-assembly protein
MVNNYMIKFSKILFLVFAASATFYSANAADGKSTDKKSYLESDELSYDRKLEALTATGNVSIEHESRKLYADKVIYDQKNQDIEAIGRVKMVNDDGSIYYADEVFTNQQITHGNVKNLVGKLADGSEFAASNGELIDRKKVLVYDAEYSPCEKCDGSYFWSVKADRIKYNEETGRVGYRNATLNFFDVPVIYTPFISHPTPNAKSKSGFLTPAFGGGAIGFNIAAPYYYQPAPNYDFTFSPRILLNDLPVLAGEHRNILENGSYEIAASATYPEERDDFGNRIAGGGREFRGHFEGKGEFDISNDWDFNFDAKRASDDTYLRRYKYGNEDILTSQAALQKILDRNFIEVKTVSFQSLRAGDKPSETPYVLPLVSRHDEIKLDKFQDAFFTSDFNFMHLDRDEGAKSRRLSQTFGINAKKLTLGGSLLEYGASVRGDAYNYDDVLLNGTYVNGSRGRFIPEAEAKWSLPLIKRFESSSLVIEPVVNTTISPNGNNSDLIPNEDSQNFEFADYNIFESSRYSGLDRVESGSRTSYGLRSNFYNVNTGNLGLVFGQIYRASKDRLLTPETGMNDNLSDYVGRFTMDNGKYFSANYRYRVNKRDFKFERNEVGFDLTFDKFSLGTNYFFINEKDGKDDRQEVSSNISFNVTDNWRISTHATENLNNDNNRGLVTAGTGLEFFNECLKASVEVRRDYIRDRDIEPTTEFMFKFTLQNIGMD